MLIENEHFKLFVRENDVVMSLIKTGYPLKSFDLITREYPRFKLGSFTTLRKALVQVGEEHIIGTWLPLVEATASSDKLTLEIIINASMQEIEENKAGLLEEVDRVLDKLNVVYGRQDLRDVAIKPGFAIIGAKGREPVKGADAVITYIERPPRKPLIREDGTANHYEMNFVFSVEANQWLGEKVLPKNGVDGMDIYGNAIPALRGDDAKIKYDRKSIFEEEEEEKIVIRALHGGTLEQINGLISVGELLVIAGDVGPGTGSISFEGAVKVLGTVRDGYSVTATDDISIEGNEGITNAKMIHSSEGDVYIKGGVFGSGVTTVEAKGKIYLKHANNCKLYAEEIHVGLYLFGTEVSADHVYVDKHSGRIIGGTVEAQYTIECAVAGNLHERETILLAKGINRTELYKDIQTTAKELKEHQELVIKLKEHSSRLEKVVANLSKEQVNAYEKTLETINQSEVEILRLDKEIQANLKIMKLAKPAVIVVTKEAFPGTTIKIGKNSTTLATSAMGEFQVVDGVLNV